VRPGLEPLAFGKGEVHRTGRRVAILAFGTLLKPALEAGDALDATVVNMRFVKPLDAELAARMAREHELVVTVEENTVMGGAGSAVAEALSAAAIATPVLRLGLPDRFVDHGDQGQLLATVGLDAAGIAAAVRARLA
jgi:1-deoxy-D-xylulose-5-phosphate synthase